MTDHSFNRLAELLRDPLKDHEHKCRLISREVKSGSIRPKDIEAYWHLYFGDVLCPPSWRRRVSAMALVYSSQTKPSTLAECVARAIFRDETLVNKVIHDVDHDADILSRAAECWSHYMLGYIPVTTRNQFYAAMTMRTDIETKRTLVNARKARVRAWELHVWNSTP